MGNFHKIDKDVICLKYYITGGSIYFVLVVIYFVILFAKTNAAIGVSVHDVQMLIEQIFHLLVIKLGLKVT